MKIEKKLTFIKMLKFNRYFRMTEPTISGKIKIQNIQFWKRNH